MPEINYAEFEDRVFRGDVTLAEARRMGSSHKAYGWSSSPPGSWNAEQIAAYKEGYHESDDPRR